MTNGMITVYYMMMNKNNNLVFGQITIITPIHIMVEKNILPYVLVTLFNQGDGPDGHSDILAAGTAPLKGIMRNHV